MRGRACIAVIGAGSCDESQAAVAEEVGRLLARAGALVVSGGLGGVMAAACRGAKVEGGTTLALLPGLDRDDANEWVDVAVPTGLGEARNVLAEVLDTVDAEKRGAARATLRDEIAASLACHAAIKVNMPLAPEKMRWLIDRLLMTSSPTTCPHGRPVILRLATQDILKGFHRI